MVFDEMFLKHIIEGNIPKIKQYKLIKCRVSYVIILRENIIEYKLDIFGTTSSFSGVQNKDLVLNKGQAYIF